MDDVANIKVEIKKCGKGWKSVSCLAKLAEKMEEEIVSLPKDISDDIKKVVTLIENIQPEIKNCGTTAVNNCQSQGKALLTKISLCVTEKIIHK